MKAAIIDSLGSFGGLHYYTDGVAKGLQNAGIEVTVFTSEETGRTGKESYRVEMPFRGVYGDGPAPLRLLRFFWGTIKAVCLARMSGCRIAHFHSIQRVAIQNITEPFGVVLAWLTGLKVVLTLHDIESEWRAGRAAARWLMLRLASTSIVHNAFSRDQLAIAAPGHVASKRTFVIPSGHYIDQFVNVPNRCQAREKLGLPGDKTVFLFFGNPRLDKGLDILLHAMAAFRNEPGVMLLVGGKMKPDWLALYRKIIEDENIGDRVRMDVGHVSDQDIPLYYVASDLVVVPYRRVYDSAVTLMAMSFGRAVLASDLPPLLESTVSGRYGMHFKSEDSTDLAHLLRRAFEDREALDALGGRGRDYVLKERNWNAVGASTAAVYRKTCGPLH